MKSKDPETLRDLENFRWAYVIGRDDEYHTAYDDDEHVTGKDLARKILMSKYQLTWEQVEKVLNK